MPRKTCKTGGVVALAAASVIIAAGQVAAAPTLRLTTSSGASVTITDETAGDLTLGTPGIVSYAGGLGAFAVQITVGQTKPTLGSESRPILKMSNTSIDLAGGTSETLTIEFSETDFTGQGVQRTVAAVGGDVVGHAQLSSYDVFVDTANILFGAPPAGQVAALGPLGGSPFSDTAGDTIDLGTAPTAYSVTQVMTVTGAPGSNISFDASVRVPGPASLGLLGGALLGLVALTGLRAARRPHRLR